MESDLDKKLDAVIDDLACQANSKGLKGHSFTWGDDWDDLPKGAASSGLYKPRWQVELQMMVIADDPIAYLGEHI